ncbi:MAG: hypothetical protein LBG20_03645 [Holosporaceae bacterium]|nr:hypothetical protein [Holosporaceae bacterium]
MGQLDPGSLWWKQNKGLRLLFFCLCGISVSDMCATLPEQPKASPKRFTEVSCSVTLLKPTRKQIARQALTANPDGRATVYQIAESAARYINDREDTEAPRCSHPQPLIV